MAPATTYDTSLDTSSTLSSRLILSDNDKIVLYFIAGYTVAILILYNFPVLKHLLYPFKLITTALHEFGHAAAGLCTGAKIKSIQVDPDTGGVTKMQGGIRCCTLPAGYLGSSFFGGLLVFAGFNLLTSKIGAAFIGLCLLIVLFLASNWLTRVISFGYMGLIAFLWWYNESVGLPYFVLFLGVMTSLQSLWDMQGLILYKHPESDATKFAEMCGCGSPRVWGFIWNWMITIMRNFFILIGRRVSAHRACVLTVGLGWCLVMLVVMYGRIREDASFSDSLDSRFSKGTVPTPSKNSSLAKQPATPTSPFPVFSPPSVNLTGQIKENDRIFVYQRKSYPQVRILPLSLKKRILVTGGAGFVGSHLVDKLMEQGHDVIVLDNFFTGHKRNIWHWVGHSNFQLIRHDVINPFLAEVDQIYHLACPASPPHYQLNPVKTVKTSVLGTINMLGLAKRVKARLLLASTSEIYGDPKEHPQKESYWGHVNPIGHRACYDEGKRVAETLCISYAQQSKVQIRIARIFNTFGPRMNAADGRVVSNFILQALLKQPITVYGEGKQTRSFQYVDDLISGLISLMNSNITVPVNLGNPDEISIGDFATKIQQQVSPDTPIDYRAPVMDDPQTRRPDISKAKKELNWEPKVSTEDGLKKTVEYFRALMNQGFI